MSDLKITAWFIGLAFVHGIVGKIFDDDFVKWFAFFILAGPVTTVGLLVTIWENISQLKNTQDF